MTNRIVLIVAAFSALATVYEAPARASPPPTSAASAATPGAAAKLEMHTILLPGAGPEGVLMDYIALDPATERVWVPAGNTGSVDVIDSANDKVTRIEGFATAEIERNGRKRVVGPSSATVGHGVVYVGNRGNSTVCAVDAKELKIGACGKLAAAPDGLAYVASAKQVWVTTPRDSSITILDGGTLATQKVLKLEGEPEGFAVDDARGRFYTNLEDKDKTLAIDIGERRVLSTWDPRCGKQGPRGLALDRTRNFLIVACTDHVEVLDAGHGGKILSKLDTGEGVDNIDYLEARRELYVGAGKAAMLTMATLDDEGVLATRATVATVKGARNPVANASGVAYLTDSAEGKILVIGPAPSPQP
jgi:DNA-binding beta-propeller fold protein YncE